LPRLGHRNHGQRQIPARTLYAFDYGKPRDDENSECFAKIAYLIKHERLAKKLSYEHCDSKRRFNLEKKARELF
jgi:hypothetical protein